MENQDIWKDIEDYEGYYKVSTLGKVKSIKFGREKILKVSISEQGYRHVQLTKGTEKNFRVGRLTAIAFIPNPENKRTVNHKNGIKTDDRVENLEWNTHGENLLHAYMELGRKSSSPWLGKFGKEHHSSKPVLQYSKSNNFIIKFDGMSEAERITGIKRQNIAAVCNGKQKTAGNFIWKLNKT